MQTALLQLLSKRLRKPIGGIRPVSGGSINNCFRIEAGGQPLFLKTNSASDFPGLFQTEKGSLERLARPGIIRIPNVLDCFKEGGQQFLLLEWITEGERTEDFWKRFGEALATQHRIPSNDFGLEENNYMGSVPQSNRRHKSWTAFFTEERLRPMVKRCFDKRLFSKTHSAQVEKLIECLPEIFEEEKPSLLHGDLWSGNFMCGADGQPVLIDPAVYYGHRSVDLAMTTLFGGFRQPFYDAYNHHFPLPKNHKEQWEVCNLYPLLIHLYLFGSGYLSQIERTLLRFA